MPWTTRDLRSFHTTFIVFASVSLCSARPMNILTLTHRFHFNIFGNISDSHLLNCLVDLQPTVFGEAHSKFPLPRSHGSLNAPLFPHSISTSTFNQTNSINKFSLSPFPNFVLMRFLPLSSGLLFYCVTTSKCHCHRHRSQFQRKHYSIVPFRTR